MSNSRDHFDLDDQRIMSSESEVDGNSFSSDEDSVVKELSSITKTTTRALLLNDPKIHFPFPDDPNRTNFFVIRPSGKVELIHGCYCGKIDYPSTELSEDKSIAPSRLRPQIWCCECNKLFHPTCISIDIQPYPLPGDFGYEFTCKNCNNGQETFFWLQKTWVQITTVALYNLCLMKNDPRIPLFSPCLRFTIPFTKKQISDYIAKNWWSLSYGSGAKHLSKNWKNGLASQLARRGNVYKLQPLSDGTHAWLLLGPNVFRIKPEINGTRRRTTTGNSSQSKENINSSISKKRKKKKRPRITYRFGDNESDYEFETQEMTQWVHTPKNAEDIAVAALSGISSDTENECDSFSNRNTRKRKRTNENKTSPPSKTDTNCEEKSENPARTSKYAPQTLAAFQSQLKSLEQNMNLEQFSIQSKQSEHSNQQTSQTIDVDQNNSDMSALLYMKDLIIKRQELQLEFYRVELEQLLQQLQNTTQRLLKQETQILLLQHQLAQEREKNKSNELSTNTTQTKELVLNETTQNTLLLNNSSTQAQTPQ